MTLQLLYSADQDFCNKLNKFNKTGAQILEYTFLYDTTTTLQCRPRLGVRSGSPLFACTVPHSTVGNGSDCRSRGGEIDPCLVPYFSGD